MNTLPYVYALLVFAIVAFLFILLGRIFLNVETIYFYDYVKIIKKDDNDYKTDLKFVINKKGEEGWKFDRIEDIMSFGQGAREVMVIFVKSKSKIKLFK